MANEVWDAIVVGAGIEGSATAYTFAKNGKRTLLLEQFLLPHTRGSSGGPTRITRKCYDREVYISMMVEGFPLWEKLEQETNTKLYTQHGFLVIDKEPLEYYNTSLKAFKILKVPYKTYSAEDLRREFPMIKMPSEYVGCLDIEGGTLKADKALLCFQKMFIQFGGVLHDGEPVQDIFPGNIVNVRTSRGNYKTRSLVITAGPWASGLLKPLGIQLPLKVSVLNVCYWRIKKGMETLPHIHKHMAAVRDPEINNNQPLSVYSIPCEEYKDCMKLCVHGGFAADPDKRDEVMHTKDIQILEKYVRNHFPFLEDKPCIVEKCMYTMTPDEHPVIDRHPGWNNIVFATGFSGHGFKLAPVVGKILMELVTGKPPSYDLSLFKQDRFMPKSARL